ncbi:putative membrane protein [Tenacibaculum adriaticum]|uniref:Putative membrane protein n=1 Tax=Tenacibaculum adriaticum TaxID=413713 RepID=A0A5S5DWV9_9FLAO|nr:vitamin K epoxide reductase family protein [Tenacibaculum adriaticum]TYQ00332.1 putative membrane protein [Tenacibaculum adriaticum]
MKDTLFLLVQKLLSNNKIHFDKKELSFQIQSHPSYPSLHAVTGVLDHFNIENVAAEVPVDLETLKQLPDSFLAQIHTDKGNDLVVVEKNSKESNYHIFSANNKKEKYTESVFLEKFTGIIVAIEKPENETVESSGVKNKFLLGILVGALVFIVFYKNPELSVIGHLFLSLVGIMISLVILKQENGEETVIGNAFCSGNTEKKDCDAVLSSKGAALIKGHKLSDLSLIYFSGLTISTLLLLPNFSVVYLISFLAFPITLYSIYYQYAVVKKWCLLCLTIVGVLWLQSAIALINIQALNNYSFYPIVLSLLGFTSVYIIWNYLKPLFLDVNSLKKDKIEHIKFKRNYALFDSLLQKSPTLNTRVNSSKEIIFGNKDSKLEIVVVTNPFCGHCRPVHKVIEDILKRYKNNVKIIIRFNIAIDNLDANGVRVASRLIELFNTKSEQECLQAMHDIYEGEEVGRWLSKWGNTQNIEVSLSVLEVEKEWCTKNAINFTPEILLNGKSYPKEYKREDLLFFVEELEESCCTETVNTQLVN